MKDSKLEADFLKAVDSINNHQEAFPADVLLKLYAYYKRATNAPHQASESREALITAFKTNALFQTQHLSEEEAKQHYIDTVNHYFLYRK